MARPNDLQPVGETDGLDRMRVPEGYLLGGMTPQDILAADAELLRSEGIEPTWADADVDVAGE